VSDVISEMTNSAVPKELSLTSSMSDELNVDEGVYADSPVRARESLPTRT